jgi:diguanylate cyclase (GGDEF)-like protein/PAS domain S-box-containing protein
MGTVDAVSRVLEPGLPARPFGGKFYERLLENMYDGVYFVDRSRRILYWNRGAEHLTGYSRHEVVGRACHDNILCHVDQAGTCLCQGYCPLLKTIQHGEPGSARVFLKHKEGHRVAVDVFVMPIFDEDGHIIGGVEVFRDASAILALEAAYMQMRELAEKDALTSAVNRRHAEEILSEQARLLRRTGVPFTVVMADIDHFKQINDRWGHAAGDAVLVGFVSCLERNSRKSDIVARMGGEEFLVILPGLTVGEGLRAAERLRLAVAVQEFPELQGQPLTASFGVTEARRGEAVEELLQRVDALLYQAKTGGRNQVVAG